VRHSSPCLAVLRTDPVHHQALSSWPAPLPDEPYSPIRNTVTDPSNPNPPVVHMIFGPQRVSACEPSGNNAAECLVNAFKAGGLEAIKVMSAGSAKSSSTMLMSALIGLELFDWSWKKLRNDGKLLGLVAKAGREGLHLSAKDSGRSNDFWAPLLMNKLVLWAFLFFAPKISPFPLEVLFLCSNLKC
jgi:hypothetical protein